ncbi:MAG: AAA family ATPase [Firmicutes bacterium]|nr:AAA family ATPase [Bacillota bacterium]
MRLKKVILNNFGVHRNTEISLDTPFTVVGGEDANAGKTVIDAIVGVLFGCPPDRRGEFSRYAPSSGRRRFSASLFLTAENGKEYLIGKNFHREEVEVFQEEDLSLTLLPANSLMEILYNELKTLNPIDFEALFVFNRGPVEIRLDSPVLREQLNKIWSRGVDREAIEEILAASQGAAADLAAGAGTDTPPPAETGGETGDAGTAGAEEEPEPVKAALLALEAIRARLREVEEEIEEIRTQDGRRRELETELAQVKAEREELAPYEPFVAGGSEMTVEGLSHKLTTIELERKYLEEKVREKRESEASVQREIRILREKIAAFPQEFMDPGLQDEVKTLVRQREEKLQMLRKLEEQLKIHSSRKGILGLGGRRPEVMEIEEKIARQLDEISVIRNRLNTLLKGRPAEDFLQEVELQKKYLEDLAKLEKMPVAEGEVDNFEEQLRELVRMEEEIRGKMRDLLAQAGSEEHEEIREKVKRLSLLIDREKELESEIAALAASASAERLAALVAERMKLEKEEGEQEEAVELRRKEAAEERAARERAEAAAKEAEKAEFRVDYLPEAGEDAAGEDPFVHSFSRLAILVHCLTGGKYNGVLPEFREDGIDLLVREEATASWVSQQVLPPETGNLIRLAFRVFLARLHTPARSFPLLFETPPVPGSREEGERVLALLGQAFPEVQIIAFLTKAA